MNNVCAHEHDMLCVILDCRKGPPDQGCQIGRGNLVQSGNPASDFILRKSGLPLCLRLRLWRGLILCVFRCGSGWSCLGGPALWCCRRSLCAGCRSRPRPWCWPEPPECLFEQMEILLPYSNTSQGFKISSQTEVLELWAFSVKKYLQKRGFSIQNDVNVLPWVWYC